jgi:hypothetical protein
MTADRLLGQSVRDAEKPNPYHCWRNRGRDAEHLTCL